jgi:hypothetical protein
MLGGLRNCTNSLKRMAQPTVKKKPIRKRKPNNIFHVVHMGMLPYDIAISVQTDEAFIKSMSQFSVKKRELKWIGKMKGKAGACTQLKDGPVVLRVKEDMFFPNSPNFHAFFTHECLHAVTFIFRRIGVRFGKKSEELWAYAMDHVQKEFYAHIYKYNKSLVPVLEKKKKTVK